MSTNTAPVLVVGSLGIDDIITPLGEVKNALGGSSSYAAMAAGFFTDVRLVGVVGKDFSSEHVNLLKNKGVDLEGLKVVEDGDTFRWVGKYRDNFKERVLF